PAPGHLSLEPHSPSPPPSFAHLQTPLSPPPRCAHARAPPPLNRRRPSSFPRRRWSSAVLFATVSSAPTSATRDTLQFPLPLSISLCPRSPAALRAAAEVRHRRPGPSSRHCRHRGVPGARLEVRNLSRPSRPLYCLLSRLIARRSPFAPPPSRFAVDRPPPVPLPRPSPHQKTPRAFPNLSGRSGRPRDPQTPAPLVSGEFSAAGTSAAAPASRRGGQGRPPDPRRPSQIGRPCFN
ncbi:hypothetical protein Zm00014a_016512, partial [Zea mays]